MFFLSLMPRTRRKDLHSSFQPGITKHTLSRRDLFAVTRPERDPCLCARETCNVASFKEAHYPWLFDEAAEQLLIGDDRGIELEANGLGEGVITRTNALIRWGWCMGVTARVTHPCTKDSDQLAVFELRLVKSAKPKDSRLGQFE